MSQTNLGEFVARIRTEMGWSLDVVADRARKAGHDISPAYVNKIEGGADPEGISRGRIKALAAGLMLDREALEDVIDGKVPPTTSWKLARDAHGRAAARLELDAEQLARDGKEPGRQVAASLKIPGVVTGDRMGDIQHAKPWIPWEDDEPAALPWVAIVGEVGCGQLRLEDPDKATRRFPVPERYAKAAAFAVIARGDSLNALGPPREPIKDGDLLLVRKVREPEQGAVVIAYVPEEGAAAKVYWKKGGVARLRPWSTNPEHEAIAVDDQVQIVGEVFAVLPAPRDLEGE